jgi:hypothetical protein
MKTYSRGLGGLFNSINTLSLKFLLFKASQMGNQEIVKLLLNNQKFDSINEKSESGYTALH